MPVSEKDHIRALSQLVLNPAQADDALSFAASLGEGDREQLLRIADSHHVTVRAMSVLHETARLRGNDLVAYWALRTIELETQRISTAVAHLAEVVQELESHGCPVVVMKSLDHWPDLGNDLDLYSTATERQVADVFTNRLRAEIEPRSWGDRLAQKWNFKIPGLRESVEVHVQRLGQTGEHTRMAQRLVGRRVYRELMGYNFPVPAPEERVIVATLQRMYRHFYFRICDIANTAAMVEQNEINYRELERAAHIGGIWPGVCTYLKIVSDYVEEYRGEALLLPVHVVETAVCGGEQVHPKNRFLRVPIMPHGAQLYTKQVTTAALRGDVGATFRLSLLPPLASVAALAYKVTGSDKGIW
ncbi:MAG TPA: nucleotidyltransferase family protein [Terriglobales bacterium]|nr:nucleotidyltransferase family protein [Terriglobales bacterium]